MNDIAKLNPLLHYLSHNNAKTLTGAKAASHIQSVCVLDANCVADVAWDLINCMAERKPGLFINGYNYPGDAAVHNCCSFDKSTQV